MTITVFNKPQGKGKRTLPAELERYHYERYKPYQPYGHPDHPFPQRLAYKAYQPYGHPDHPWPTGGTPPVVVFKPREKSPDRNVTDFLEHNEKRLPPFVAKHLHNAAEILVEKEFEEEILEALGIAGFDFETEEDN